jgi:acyl-[acyl-carrier-protein]-phospholipid O-acyltransferase/long-chain-fatty-acid--[acyl-carrier-protein] ligase
MHHKPGTVGRFLPGIEYQLETVSGLKQGKRLIVSGPNVMLGYLKTDNPGVLQRTENQRYDTGDIVDIDEAGFVTILGRAKRFAKIAGEMVSLTAVEANAAEIWPDNNHAVMSVEDARKGERLILVTDRKDAERKSFLKHAKDNAIGEIMVPRSIHVVDQMPLLGTGKIDYVSVQKILEQAVGK